MSVKRNFVFHVSGNSPTPIPPKGSYYLITFDNDNTIYLIDSNGQKHSSAPNSNKEENNGDSLIDIKKTLSTPEILTLNSSPIDLGIAKPSNNQIIQIISAYAKLNYNTAFVPTDTKFGGSVILIYEGLSNPIIETSHDFLPNNSDIFMQSVLSPFPKQSSNIAPGRKILLSSGSDCKSGNGSVDIYVTYRLMTI